MKNITAFPALAAQTRFLSVAALLILLFSCSKKTGPGTGNPPPEPPPAVKFEVSQSRILDQDGNEFVARGVNVNGPNWPWSRLTLPDVNLITDTWKCNIVRLNCWAQNPPYNNPNNADMDAIVTAFTNKKIVVLLEDHSFTGVYPNTNQLTTSVAWWTALANKYKGNPYVWFNLMNEPGGGGAVPADWLQTHEAMIVGIRGTGAENIIVCDEHGFGQAGGYNSNTSSGVLTYGETLTGKYKNIAFSLHLYDSWIYGKDRLEAYTTAVQAKKLAIMIGEYGVANDYSSEVASNVMKVCIPKKIGRIAWHWVGEDIHQLTTATSGGGWAIDNTSGAKPGNLSFAGNLVWLDNHQQLQVGDAALEPPPVLIANPSFDGGSPSNNSSDIKGWINFGTARLDNNVANVKQGSYALRIEAGTAGGCGQPFYLQPGSSYRITAWGKNSQLASAPSVIGVKYTAPGSSTEVQAVSLDFTEGSYQEKTATFTLPASIASLFIFVYKNDAVPAFWVDDVRIEKI